MLKKILAALMAASLAATMAVPSFASNAAGSQSVTGDNDVKNPIYSFQVPASLDFAVDAFQKTGDSQIFSIDFPILNKSDVALRATVSAKIKAKTLTADKILVKEPAEINQTDISNTDNEIYLEMVPALTAKTESKSTATAASTTLERPTIEGSATSNAVTFTDQAAATFVLDLAGLTAKDPNSNTFAAYTLTLLDEDGAVIAAANSAAATAATSAATDLATAFNTKTFTLEGETFTAGTATGSTITFTGGNAAALGLTYPNATFVLSAQKGTPADVVVDMTTANVPTYPAYVTAAGAASTVKSKVKLDGADADAPLTFVLDKAVYGDDYKDDPEDTLFTAVAASDKGVSSFRFMGTVNPNATWKANDFSIEAMFDIGGVTGDAYTAIGTDDNWAGAGEGQNLTKPVAAPGAPSVATSATLASVTDNGQIKIPYSLGGGALGAAAVTKVEFARASAPTTFTVAASPAQYTDDTANKKIVFVSGFTNAMSAGGKVRLTFNDGATTVSTIDLTV